MAGWPEEATNLRKTVRNELESRVAGCAQMLVLLLSLALISLFCPSRSDAWWSVTFDVDTMSTHDAIGKRALSIVAPQFRTQFLMDKGEAVIRRTYPADNDEAAHAGDGERNGGPIGTWYSNFLSEYSQGPTHWDEAARWLGYCVHLIEDMNVPAHALNIPHALGSLDNFLNIVNLGDYFEYSGQAYPLITFNSPISESSTLLPADPATYYYNDARQRTRTSIETTGFTSYWKAGIPGIDDDYKADGPRGHYGGPVGIDIFPSVLMGNAEMIFLEQQLNHSVEYAGMFLLGVDRILTAQATDDSYEENDTSSAAPSVEVPFYDATLKCNDDDWFKVWVQKDEKVEVTINLINANGDLDLYLYDSAGYRLNFSESNSNTEMVSYGPSYTDQYYYIKVHGWNSGKNSYDMSVNTYTTSSPDLRGKFVRSKSVVTEGDDSWVSWYIYNSGLSRAGSSHARLYLSTNGNSSTYGDYMVGDVSVSPLEPLSGKWVTWSFKMPNLSSGQYPVWGKVIVDSWDEVYEGIEDYGAFIKTGSNDFMAFDVRTLSGLTIVGPSIINESSTAAYSAVASWSDGTATTITPLWSEDSPYAIVSNEGMLTSTAISGNKFANLTARYGYGGVTKTATQPVTIVDVTATLVGLSIHGPEFVKESEAAVYVATASWSNGIDTVVRPTWSENSVFASISDGGVLSAQAVSSDQACLVTAAYTLGGITKTVAKAVGIVNFDTTPDSFDFHPLFNLDPDTVVISNSIVVKGLTAPAPISIMGGSYSVNGGGFTATSGTVGNGDEVRVRLTSSPSYSTTTSATLTIGGVSDTFSATTSSGTSEVLLDVTLTGTGGGSVSGDVSCISGTACSPRAFPAGTPVSLLATPNALSTFSGWSGSCATVSRNCTVTMDAAKSVTATFAAAAKVRVGSKEFFSLQAAYDDAGTQQGAIIKLLGGVLTGNFVADRGLDVTIEGGYQPDYSAVSTETTVHGALRIRGGRVKVKGITAGPQPVGHIPGDLNYDGRVDIRDLSILASRYGEIGCGNIADINGDCIVGGGDSNILSSNYGRSN